jgi:hypothetical protein
MCEGLGVLHRIRMRKEEVIRGSNDLVTDNRIEVTDFRRESITYRDLKFRISLREHEFVIVCIKKLIIEVRRRGEARVRAV